MRKKILVILAISIVYILGFPFLKNEVLDAKYILTIEVLPDVNGQSLGTEVWIDSIEKDEELINLLELPLDGNWENRGRLFNSGTENTKWEIKIRSKETTVITFVTHPYSGCVRVTNYKGEVQELDLYSANEGTKSYELKY